ncbi:MAG: Cytochrome c Snr1 [Candidatus Jettenia ecosi]|uniref:Cytochrome c Snr1 n=1 Tax=Candidatus Jettenia ecosi TaxID=2494326 RepID=A0A533QF22_9BACT|nr:MAG: Cytochrome c Snr1 [Candidatus Jettenia ecosi]
MEKVKFVIGNLLGMLTIGCILTGGTFAHESEKDKELGQGIIFDIEMTSDVVETFKKEMKDIKEGIRGKETAPSQKEEPEKKIMEGQNVESEKMMMDGKQVSKKEVMFGKREISEAEKQLMIGLKEGNEEKSRITPVQRMEIEKRMGTSFLPIAIKEPFEMMMEKMKAAKPEAAKLHNALLEERYDLSNKAAQGVKMSRGKPVQEGVRVKLAGGMTWEKLGMMSSEDIEKKGLFPQGFMPLSHPNHAIGGMVFIKPEIDEIKKLEDRDLNRFDVDFDLPDHFLPEFPPPLFLTTRPDLGDVTQGKLVNIKNFSDIFKGILNPKQLEGLRLLVTPFPQQEFNQTDDRRTEHATLGVACLDCHVNGHTNGTIELLQDLRPQPFRKRLDTPTMRGVYAQQLFGLQRSIQTIEDFSEFEQRTAYFDGDHVTAAKKGVFQPDRLQVEAMAEFQRMLDFPPAPMLDAYGMLDPKQNPTESETRGQALFFGKAKCGVCHPAPAHTDNKRHDLKLERFYEPCLINGVMAAPEGPVKTFPLRGIKDSPPYFHDGRLLTLDDAVEFFNLIFELKLTEEEKKDLVAFMLRL